MNSKEFSRDIVTRYITKQKYTMDDLISEFGFADEQELKKQLGRIYNQNGKEVSKVLKSLKNNLKNKKNSRKSDIEAFVPADAEDLTVPYNQVTCTEVMKVNPNFEAEFEFATQEPMTELKPGNVDDSIETIEEGSSWQQLTVEELTNSEQSTVEEVTNIEQLTVGETANGEKLSQEEILLKFVDENMALVNELKESIKNDLRQYERDCNYVSKSTERIKRLQEQVKNEWKRAQGVLANLAECETRIKENTSKQKKLQLKVTEKLEELRRLNTKRIYFGNNADMDCDIFAHNVEVSEDNVKLKIAECVEEFPEDLSLKQVKVLAHMLCVVESVMAQMDDEKKELELLFDVKDELSSTLIEMTKLNYEYAVVESVAE